ncbi:MAG: MBOAT family protein [Bradyrhizobium sp.]|nr:MBOAT family protein [Bradyrhizobium sp.]
MLFDSAAAGGGPSLNSFEFLLISALAVAVSCAINQQAVRNYALLLLSLLFFASFGFDLASIVVLFGFLAVSYWIGLIRKRRGKAFTMEAQLVVVALFWIFLFLARDSTLLGQVNPFHYLPIHIIGISYMVFRCICYLMEVEFIERPSFGRFCLYALFFPALLAGPIERYRTFEGQLASPNFDPDATIPALHRIANGMIKKFVLADNLAAFGIFSFDNAADMSGPMLWMGALSQLGLIYLDFSGYCDIVIGAASLMGFKLLENFNRPFDSTSIQEFWNRWHISLSTLVRDYIFTPINIIIIKKAPRGIQFALISLVYFGSMILIGLWHGVTWGFLAFGTLHGGALVGSQLKRRYFGVTKRGPASRVEIYLKRFFVYAFVSVSLILWLKSYSEWGAIYGKMLGLQP